MENKNSHFLKLVRVILVMSLVISLVILLIGAIVQWKEPAQFSNAFFAAGAFFFVLGFLSVSGGFAQRGNFNMTYAESAGQANISERTLRMMGEITQRYGAMALFGIVGLLLIVISVLIGTFLVN